MYLNITGMTCDSCATHVKDALEKVPGVLSALVSYPKGSAQLATDPGTSPEALTAAVAGLGYKATPADAPSTSARGRLLGKAVGPITTAPSWKQSRPRTACARCSSAWAACPSVNWPASA